MKRTLLHLILACGFAITSGRAAAATYDVGPGYAKVNLRDVPWKSLLPGDIVNIHYKPGGYHEKIQISASGTAAQHIVIRGIPDSATGALPIIDGQGAIEDPGTEWRSGADILSDNGIIIVTPRNLGYTYGSTHVSFVDIETLDVRNATYSADGSVTYTDRLGVVRGYSTFAAAIYVEWAHDLTVRGCEMSNCGIGFFANSKNLAAQSSARLLIEKNYFHDNSNPAITDASGKVLSNGFGEHHIYTESAGCVIQFNRFGKMRPNAHGLAIKDRSSGQIIRYNEFDVDGSSNVFSLNDPQGGIGYIEAQPDYLDSFVYGNVFILENYTGGLSAFRWGAWNGSGTMPDGRNSYQALHRRTLYFYHNTVVCHHSGTDLFMMPDNIYTGAFPTYENIDCRNNVFYCDPAIQGNIYNAMRFSVGGTTNGGGDISLGVNWVSPDWRKDPPSHAWSGALTGTANLLVGDGTSANDPHFVDMNAHNFHVLTGSNILDTAGALSLASLPANDVTLEYLSPHTWKTRVTQNGAPDLGALESTGFATPPPTGGALQFSASNYTRSESGVTATITVSRIGGTTGTVGVSYMTAAGGTASPGSDYTPVVGTLTWAPGDAASKTFQIPITNDNIIETNETMNLALFAPTGGAIVGTLSTATLTITDDDMPPSTLMYGIGETTNVLFLFTSGPPVTILSFKYLSGLVSGDVVRALAVHPSSGKLYAIGTAGVLYVVNPFTGAAAVVGSPGVPMTSNSMDLAFDRVTGQLLVTNNAGLNITIDPASGALVSTGSAPAFNINDVNSAFAPQVSGASFGFNNGVNTVYGIDCVKGVLVTMGSPGGAPVAPSNGQLFTVGSLGVNTTTQAALHIPDGAAYGWASLSPQGGTGTGLYVINLSTGSAVQVGTIRSVEFVRDFAVASAHDAWRQSRFGVNAGNPAIAGDNADPDGNGMNNFIEFALGAQPGDPSSAIKPVTGIVNGYLTLTFTRPVSATDVVYTVQVSDDLTKWDDGSSYSFNGDTITNTFTTQISRTITGNMETITVSDNTPASAKPQRFMRLVVSSP